MTFIDESRLPLSHCDVCGTKLDADGQWVGLCFRCWSKLTDPIVAAIAYNENQEYAEEIESKTT